MKSATKLQSRMNPEIEHQPSVDSEIERFISRPTKEPLQIELNENFVADLKPLYSLPEKPEEMFEVGNLAGLKPFEETFYDFGFPMTGYGIDYDIDGDGIVERIYFFGTGTGDVPQLMQIEKNGQVIFEQWGSSLGYEEVKVGYGFLLTTFDKYEYRGMRVRYVVETDGAIKPLWQQRFVPIGH